MTEQERIAIRARAWDELHEENLRTNYGQREAPSVKIYKDTAVLTLTKLRWLLTNGVSVTRSILAYMKPEKLPRSNKI